MKRCAFLTLADPLDFFIDDELAYAPLQALDWHVEALPWQQPDVPWHTYNAVVIRSTWDYQHNPEAFLAVLAQIERADTQLFNSLHLVRWNLRKTYLRELAARGVDIVPTTWRAGLSAGDLNGLFKTVGAEEMVVKPLIGANADGAFRLARHDLAAQATAVESYYADRPLMAQPLARSVLTEGEFSLFYFNGAYSHCILKTPRAQDFRVQEEHGGHIQPVVAEERLRAAGQIVMAQLPACPLYARVDFVRSNDGHSFWLMELELIEPSLYLRMDPAAPDRFARALVQRVAAH